MINLLRYRAVLIPLSVFLFLFASDCFAGTVDNITGKHLSAAVEFLQGPITKLILFFAGAMGLYHSVKNHNLLALGTCIGAVLFSVYFKEYVTEKCGATVDMLSGLVREEEVSNHECSLIDNQIDEDSEIIFLEENSSDEDDEHAFYE